MTAFNIGLRYGKCGPIQAIRETKSILQTVETAVIMGTMPPMIHIAGILVGVSGILVIVLQKKDVAEEKPTSRRVGSNASPTHVEPS